MTSNLVFLQARIDSTRLPGKVLLKIHGETLIDLQIERILKSKLIGGLVILIPDTEPNDLLSKHLLSKNYHVFRGSSENVFQRFYDASKIYTSDLIIRLTADCPLVMPKLVDEMLEYFGQVQPEYLSNRLPPTFPDGLDIEIFKSEILVNLAKLTLTNEEKEHVTLAIYQDNNFHIANFPNDTNLSQHRWTVDYPEDYKFVSVLYQHFWNRRTDFDSADILQFIQAYPEHDNKVTYHFRDITLK